MPDTKRQMPREQTGAASDLERRSGSNAIENVGGGALDERDIAIPFGIERLAAIEATGAEPPLIVFRSSLPVVIDLLGKKRAVGRHRAIIPGRSRATSIS